MGDNNGFGIQGAMFRWQMTPDGDLFITIPHELTYVTSGVYSGKTALMAILWATGTVVLSLTTIAALVYGNRLPRNYLRFIILGLTGAGLMYLASCIAQYGFLFHGPAGVSMPLGIPILFIFAFVLYSYENFIFSENGFFSGTI
jgi:hypothetical protein